LTGDFLGRYKRALGKSRGSAVWAQEFMKMFGDRKEEIDEDLMLCWFSNAIMCARDELLRNEKDIT